MSSASHLRKLSASQVEQLAQREPVLAESLQSGPPLPTPAWFERMIRDAEARRSETSSAAV